VTIRGTLAALALLAAPLAAQQPVTGDSARTDSARTDGLQPRALDATPWMVRPDSARRAAGAADTSVVPQANQALGVDAEIRMALYELLGGEPVPALSRLRWLAESPVALGGADATGALRGREDLLFLLSQAYYKLGLGEDFRRTAEQLLGPAPAGRYATVLRTQLLLDAYRTGDYARVLALSRSLGEGETSPDVRALASLVAGLAAYQSRDYAVARTSFAAAQGTATPYAGFARYMDALTTLRTDTAQTGPALAALTAVADAASGELADQVRLTAAQLAYEAGRYDEARSLASRVDANGGLAASALLTQAWALYKANQVDEAGRAFAEFATRFPNLPAAEESMLMSAQTLLQRGQTAEAARVFQMVSDSASTAVAELQARSGTAMRDAAQALVDARASGLLFLREPAHGKTIALDESAGSDWSTLAASFADSAVVALATTAEGDAGPDVVALDDIAARLDSGSVVPASVSRRLFYAETSPTTNAAEYATVSQALYRADVNVSLARFRLADQMYANALRLRMLTGLQRTVTSHQDSLDAMATALQSTQDSLTRLTSALDVAAERIRQMFEAQASATLLLAQENAALVDSLRASLRGAVGPQELSLLETESSTARAYQSMAATVAASMDSLIGRQPAFALRDSLRVKGALIASLLGDTRNTIAATAQAIADELARLQTAEPENIRPLRDAVAAAEGAMGAAESRLVALVERELTARAGEMVATLRRDGEAATFGTASAAFFEALDAGGTPGAAGAATSSTTSAAPAAVAQRGAAATPRTTDAPNGASTSQR
jgi:outer membrane protein assembly factor BamD (BamD/ComL family)